MSYIVAAGLACFLGVLGRWVWLQAAREELSGLTAGAACLTALVGFPAALVLPFDAWRALRAASESAESFAVLHFVLAGWLLFIAIAHLVTEGERRHRTTRAAQVLLVGAMVASLWGGESGLLLAVPPCVTGLFWVDRLNRRGPGRLARRKELTAGLLVASAIQLGIAVAHRAVSGSLTESRFADLLTEEAARASLLIFALVAGLRFLSGGVQGWPIVASLATMATLTAPLAWLVERERLPADVHLASWVDLRGRPGPSIRAFSSPWCLQTDATPPSCRSPQAAVPPHTPLPDVPELPEMLVDNDLPRAVPRWGRWGDAQVVEVGPDAVHWTLDGRHRRFDLLSDLHDVLGSTRRPLIMVRTPHATLQDYVSTCASTGHGPACTLR